MSWLSLKDYPASWNAVEGRGFAIQASSSPAQGVIKKLDAMADLIESAPAGLLTMAHRIVGQPAVRPRTNDQLTA